MTKKGEDLPLPSSVVRYVGFARRVKDGEEALGPAATAFEMSDGHDYLSVTWCEYFDGEPLEKLRCAIEAIRNSSIDVKSKACFCVAKTDELFNLIEQFNEKPRAVFWPEDDNNAHSGIYGTSKNDNKLLERLATEAWSTYFTKDQVDELPSSKCTSAIDMR